jgi:hypothetical protein
MIILFILVPATMKSYEEIENEISNFYVNGKITYKQLKIAIEFNDFSSSEISDFIKFLDPILDFNPKNLLKHVKNYIKKENELMCPVSHLYPKTEPTPIIIGDLSQKIGLHLEGILENKDSKIKKELLSFGILHELHICPEIQKDQIASIINNNFDVLDPLTLPEIRIYEENTNKVLIQNRKSRSSLTANMMPIKKINNHFNKSILEKRECVAKNNNNLDEKNIQHLKGIIDTLKKDNKILTKSLAETVSEKLNVSHDLEKEEKERKKVDKEILQLDILRNQLKEYSVNLKNSNTEKSNLNRNLTKKIVSRDNTINKLEKENSTLEKQNSELQQNSLQKNNELEGKSIMNLKKRVKKCWS